MKDLSDRGALLGESWRNKFTKVTRTQWANLWYYELQIRKIMASGDIRQAMQGLCLEIDFIIWICLLLLVIVGQFMYRSAICKEAETWQARAT